MLDPRLEALVTPERREAIDKMEITVDRTWAMPLLSGRSEDGRTLYIDKAMPRELTIGGVTFDPAPILAAAEMAEWHFMHKVGLPYVDAVIIAEERFARPLVEKLGIDWLEYLDMMTVHRLAAFVTKAEVPGDLDGAAFEAMDIGKDQPGLADVHAPSSGGKKGKRKRKLSVAYVQKYSPDQLRDDLGRWAFQGGPDFRDMLGSTYDSSTLPISEIGAAFQRVIHWMKLDRERSEIIASLEHFAVGASEEVLVAAAVPVIAAGVAALGLTGIPEIAAIGIATYVVKQIQNASGLTLDNSAKLARTMVTRLTSARRQSLEKSDAMKFPMVTEEMEKGDEILTGLLALGAALENLDTRKFPMTKLSDFELSVRVNKVDVEQRKVFGWASVSTVNGEHVIDKQDDIVPIDEIEKAAHEFALYTREMGDMHREVGVGKLIESWIFSKERAERMGTYAKNDRGEPIEGWAVGFYVQNDSLWKALKNGERPDFSIGGRARPVVVEGSGKA